MKRLLLAVGLLATLLVPAAAAANAPGLQVSPLLYEDTLTDKVKNGHIDVANPTDTTIIVDVTVRGFKQEGDAGKLTFFDDADLAAAIQTDLKQFEIGPREAIRVLFSVDPAKLPKGGVFAAVFFATKPQEKASTSSFVSQSANVGTLLVLRNGGDTSKGGLSGLTLPFWQFGSGIGARVAVRNDAPAKGGVAIRPELSTQVLFGQTVKSDSGLVLPGNTRQFDVSRPGAYFGLLPFTVRDAATGSSRTGWVIACTGWCQWLALVLGLALLLLGLMRVIKKLLRRRRRPVRRPDKQPEAVAELESDDEIDSVDLAAGIDEPEAEVPEEAEHAVDVSPAEEIPIEEEEKPESETAPEPQPQPKPKPKRRPIQLG